MSRSSAAPCSRPLTLLYLAPRDIKIARVEREFAAYFCSALAAQGVSVELVALDVRLARTEIHRVSDPLALYGIRTPFSIVAKRTLLHQNSPSWLVALERLRVHVTVVAKRLAQRRQEDLVVYSRNFVPGLALLCLRRFRSFIFLFQCHSPPKNRLQRFVLRRVDGVIAQSRALADELTQRGDVTRAIGAHHGVVPDQFATSMHKSELRRHLGLPIEKPIAMYTGKVYPGYDEIDYILQAASMPQCKGIEFVLVGGRKDHADGWRAEAARRGLENVRFVGFVPPREIHEYQLAADVLILYYPKWVSSDYLSPGKLLAYMASGVPIVTVEFPTLKELLGDPPAATLVPSDSPGELARAIHDVIANPTVAEERAAEARSMAAEHSWDKRAERVVVFIRELQEASARRNA